MIKLIIESKTLLNEVKLEDVKQRFQSKKFKKAFNDESEPVSKKLLNQIPNDIEEKYKGALLNWLISWAIKNRAVNIPGNFKASAEIFFQIKEQKLQRFLTKKSIAQISSPEELISVVAQAKPEYDKHIANKIENSRKGEGQNLIHQTDEWEVYIPETKGAACALGKDTEWCTAAPGLDYYEDYHSKEHPLIIFINKQDPTEKYQFHYDTTQFMDRDDRRVDGKPIFYKLNEIVKSLSKKLPDATIKSANQYKFVKLPNGGHMTADPHEHEYYNSEGERHREDGPAVEATDGDKLWYRNGELHREDGPAIERENGSKEWWVSGKRHREDGPAIESVNDDKYWYQNGELHREDGPAIEWADGDKLWYRNGELHREDGPAHESAMGRKEWFLDGKLHREDGPAIIDPSGDEHWYLNGKYHREDGPAIERPNGNKYWYLNGRHFTHSDWKEEAAKLKSNETSTLKEHFQRYL